MRCDIILGARSLLSPTDSCRIPEDSWGLPGLNTGWCTSQFFESCGGWFLRTEDCPEDRTGPRITANGMSHMFVDHCFTCDMHVTSLFSTSTTNNHNHNHNHHPTANNNNNNNNRSLLIPVLHYWSLLNRVLKNHMTFQFGMLMPSTWCSWKLCLFLLLLCSTQFQKWYLAYISLNVL